MIGQGEEIQCNGLNKAYERSIHPDLWDKILYYLSDEKTPCIKGEAICIEHVRGRS